jgi:hypothetical protein
MPSLEPFDPLSAISHLRLRLNCDGLPTITPNHEPRWFAPQIEAASLGEAHNFVKREYEWSDTEKEELFKACTAVTAPSHTTHCGQDATEFKRCQS